MTITEAEISYDEMVKAVKQGQTCAECGAVLNIAWGGSFGYDCYILRCGKDVNHKGVKRDFELSPANMLGFNLFDAGKKRRKVMEKQHGEDRIKALAKYEAAAVITRDIAEEIVETLWKGAPPVEKTKAIMLCSLYNLNPLMRHIHLVKYNRYGKNREKIGEDWTIMQGIQSTRLLAHRKHHFTYLDMTPRKASKEEIEKILGDTAKPDHIYGFAHIRDIDTGAEAYGLKGRFREEKVKGEEKGNTPLNMACIQAERQALDYLYPAEMPGPGEVELADERFMPPAKNGSIEGDFQEVNETAGEVPEKLKIGSEKASTEKQEITTEVEKPEQSHPASGIDLDWLTESLKTLQGKGLKGWTKANTLSYMKTAYKVEGSTVEEAATNLEKGPALHLTKKIQEALDLS